MAYDLRTVEKFTMVNNGQDLPYVEALHHGISGPATECVCTCFDVDRADLVAHALNTYLRAAR